MQGPSLDLTPVNSVDRENGAVCPQGCCLAASCATAFPSFFNVRRAVQRSASRPHPHPHRIAAQGCPLLTRWERRPKGVGSAGWLCFDSTR